MVNIESEKMRRELFGGCRALRGGCGLVRKRGRLDEEEEERREAERASERNYWAEASQRLQSSKLCRKHSSETTSLTPPTLLHLPLPSSFFSTRCSSSRGVPRSPLRSRAHTYVHTSHVKEAALLRFPRVANQHLFLSPTERSHQTSRLPAAP